MKGDYFIKRQIFIKYLLSYKNLKEIVAEREVKVDHTTIKR
jgi:transposase-like protein